jgi:hypothetical protein
MRVFSSCRATEIAQIFVSHTTVLLPACRGAHTSLLLPFYLYLLIMPIPKLGAPASWGHIDVHRGHADNHQDQQLSAISHSTARNREKNAPLRLSSLGVSPRDLIGKVLTRVRKSPIHPSLTLEFSDHSTYQILVDSYDPAYPGVPKRLTTNMNTLFDPPKGQTDVFHVITGCALITLTDKAFEVNGAKHTQWDQNHAGVAFRFEGDSAWHCVWVTMEEYDEKRGTCIFRSYDDVYLAKLQRSLRKNKSAKVRE